MSTCLNQKDGPTILQQLRPAFEPPYLRKCGMTSRANNDIDCSASACGIRPKLTCSEADSNPPTACAYEVIERRISSGVPTQAAHFSTCVSKVSFDRPSIIF